MEMLTQIAAFCVAVSFLLAPCASDEVNLQKSVRLCGNSAVHQAQFTLPRKLKPQEEADVKSFADKDIMPHKKLMEASSGNKQSGKEENVLHHAIGKGTWREWVEGGNRSDYFTMDYHWVRRRRPIHNKQLPFVP